MRARTNVCLMTGSPRRSTEHFSYKFYTCTNPFIHLLGSSLIQWTIIRLNGKGEPKTKLVGMPRRRFATPSRRGYLCLGREVRLGGALLCLGGPECSVNLDSGTPRRGSMPRCALLRLGIGVPD